MRSMNSLLTLRYVAFLAIALFTLTACTPTGDKFVPTSPSETIALSSVMVKALSKSVKSAYAQHLISLEAAREARDKLQIAQSALVSANAATTPEDQQSALSKVSDALLIVAQILEAMQEPQP